MRLDTALRVGATALVAALVAAPNAPAADLTCGSANTAATVLLFHSGAFKYGRAAELHPACEDFAAAGFRTISIEYPLWNYRRTLTATYQAAARYRQPGQPLYAVGWSAGGTLVEELAVRGQLDAAVAIAAISDFPNWDRRVMRKVGLRTLAMQRAYSPLRRITRPAPLLLLHSPDDRVVRFSQSRALKRRLGAKTELVRLQGNHLQHEGVARSLARHWLLARVRG